MTKYYAQDVKMHLGFDSTKLDGTALDHERHPDFKVSFRTVVDAQFKDQTREKWEDLGHSGALVLAVDESTGHITNASGLAMSEVAVQRESGTMNAGDKARSYCIDTPTGWKKYRSYFVRKNSTEWNLKDVVDEYEGMGHTVSAGDRTKLEAIKIEVIVSATILEKQ